MSRKTHSKTRRVRLVRTTPGGKRNVAALIRLTKERGQRVLKPFGLARAEELKEVLRGMIELHREGT
jgi:DNA-binding MarR family transcriptional regulator